MYPHNYVFNSQQLRGYPPPPTNVYQHPLPPGSSLFPPPPRMQMPIPSWIRNNSDPGSTKNESPSSTNTSDPSASSSSASSSRSASSSSSSSGRVSKWDIKPGDQPDTHVEPSRHDRRDRRDSRRHSSAPSSSASSSSSSSSPPSSSASPPPSTSSSATSSDKNHKPGRVRTGSNFSSYPPHQPFSHHHHHHLPPPPPDHTKRSYSDNDDNKQGPEDHGYTPLPFSSFPANTYLHPPGTPFRPPPPPPGLPAPKTAEVAAAAATAVAGAGRHTLQPGLDMSSSSNGVEVRPPFQRSRTLPSPGPSAFSASSTSAVSFDTPQFQRMGSTTGLKRSNSSESFPQPMKRARTMPGSNSAAALAREAEARLHAGLTPKQMAMLSLKEEVRVQEAKVLSCLGPVLTARFNLTMVAHKEQLIDAELGRLQKKAALLTN